MIECQIICACLERRNFSMFSLNNIDETYFFVYKEEFRFIYNHYQKFGNVPDVATFLDRFPEFQFVTVAESENYLVDGIRENYVYNSSVAVLKDVANKFKTIDSREAVAYLLGRMPEFNKKLAFDACDLIHNYSDRFDGYVSASKNGEKSFIKTGLKELDDLIGGLDRREENAVITASTGVGKSWIAMFFGLNAAKQGYSVGYYSGEMSSNQVGWRIDTMYSNISNFALTRGNSSINEKYKKHLEKMSKEISGKFYCVTPKDFGGYPTVAKLGSFVEKYNLDMLIIDQMSLLEDSKSNLQRYESYTRLSKEIKSLQVMKGIPILTVVQLNRGASSKDVENPGTEHIAGSNRIAEDATLAISVKKIGRTDVEIRVMKSRNSEAGAKLVYQWDFDKFNYSFVSSEPAMLNGQSVSENSVGEMLNSGPVEIDEDFMGDSTF